MILYIADKNGLDEVKVKEIKDGLYILEENKSGKDEILENELYNLIRDTEDKINVYIFGQDMTRVVNIWNNYVEYMKNLINSLSNLPKDLDRESKIIDNFLFIFVSLFIVIMFFANFINIL